MRTAHCHRVRRLPWHHRDPFDRLLVAQAEALPAHLLSSDGMLERYTALVRRAGGPKGSDTSDSLSTASS
ncbi:PIN domain-containing protein [Pseudothauera lacus]|uniref:hypothetical protein n=1 Tax=Pseudothauera lacus TaxID=2136175 RepID=UPI002E254006